MIPFHNCLVDQKTIVIASRLMINIFLQKYQLVERVKENQCFFLNFLWNKAVDISICTSWIKDLPTLLCYYSKDDFFIADETRLILKCLPDKILTFKGEQCRVGTLSKERVTLLLCVNMSFTENVSLLLIGKSRILDVWGFNNFTYILREQGKS